MASIISFTFREAVADVEYNGKIIRKNKSEYIFSSNLFISIYGKRSYGVVNNTLMMPQKFRFHNMKPQRILIP